MRITPLLPNWLINLASPIFNVPVSAFFFGTFLGECSFCFWFLGRNVIYKFVLFHIWFLAFCHLLHFFLPYFSSGIWLWLSGVAPPSCIYIQAGATLQRLTHMGAAWSWSAISVVAFTAVLSLVPIFYKWLNKGSGISNRLTKNIKST